MEIPSSLYELLDALESQAVAHRNLAANSEAVLAKAEQASVWFDDLHTLIEESGPPEDLSGCPYFRGEGICGGGCHEEPRCMTDEPMGGWPSTRAMDPVMATLREAFPELDKPGVLGGIAETLWKRGLLHPDYPLPVTDDRPEFDED